MSTKELYLRKLQIKLPKGQSAFLWGARQTGKSTYLRQTFPNSLYYDLLESDLFLSLAKEPHRLRQELLQLKPTSKQQPIIIDEIQKVPLLLDEIHWLIENKGYQFILCGSSARKLKRGQANLLGGRAWEYEMFPLVSQEMPDFNLLNALLNGLLPSHYNNSHYQKSLKSYVNDYLTEEIRAEGLTRNLPAFARFLDAVSYSNCQLVVYKNIASDCGVDSKTVKEFYQILIDTHIGYYIEPLVKKEGRKTIQATPKFYLFDAGIANYLSKTKFGVLKGSAAGSSFENFIINELIAFRSYNDLDFKINFWRTKTDLEVDAVLNRNEVYIEIKISDHIKKADLKGLKALIEEKGPKKAILVCLEKRARTIQLSEEHSIELLPYQIFLERLWSKQIIK